MDQSMFELIVNGITHGVDVEADTPLLWVLREQLQLTGSKYGCGIASCGACSVLIDGKAVRACVTPLSSVIGKPVTTIEGLADTLYHPLQQAWIENQVPQCGYCQSGQIINALALLKTIPQPSNADIDLAMKGIICRCGTYTRIRKAIHRAGELMRKGDES